MHPSVSLLSGLRTHLRDVNADIRGHHVRKSLLMSEVLASNEWTLFTQAAFSALQCYFWIFLIMSQHKFGYIIIMYSGVLASARLCLLYPDHSHHWRLSSAAYYKMPQIWNFRWNFISSLGIIVLTKPRCRCQCVRMFERTYFLLVAIF